MPFGQTLQPDRCIEFGPFRPQHRDGVALLADFRMQPQHPLGADSRCHLDPIDIGGREHQRADHEEMEDAHGQPPRISSESVGHAGSSAAACAGAAVRSAARSLADRARGLAATSASSGVTGRLVRTAKLGATCASAGQVPRPAAGLAALDQEILDDAVFQRMKRHHGEPAARLQHALRRRQRELEFVEFFVDENPQRLKRAGGRVNFAGPRSHHLGDDVSEPPRGRDRRLLARGNDGAGDAAGMPLFAENVDDVGEIGLGRARDHVRGGRAVLAHPHVERTAETKRKAAAGLVKLHRGHPDIHHDAVDRIDALGGADLGQAGKSRFEERQPSGRSIDEIEPAGDGRSVAVDADHPGSRNVENHPAIAAGPEGGIDVNAAVMRTEHPDGLAAKHGDMSRAGRSHARNSGEGPALGQETGREQAHCASIVSARPDCSARRAGTDWRCRLRASPAANPDFRTGFGGLPLDFERQRVLAAPHRFGTSPLSNGS